MSTNLDEFTLAYIECALWSSTDESTESGGEPLDANYSRDDLAADTLERMTADCASFQRNNAALLERAYTSGVKLHYDGREHTYAEEHAGHDFWLTRNGHGAGFWDRDLGEVGDKLTDATKAYGEVHLIVGDDNMIHIG